MTAKPGGWTLCMLGHFLWCVPAGEIADRTGGSAFVDGFIGGFICCCVTSWAFLCCYCLPWGESRRRLRELHGIPGSVTEDLLVTFFLPPCALIQAVNELDLAAAEAGTRAPLPPAAASGAARNQ